MARSLLSLVPWRYTAEKRPIKFADEARLRGAAGTPEDTITNQNDLDILRSFSGKNKINK